MSNLVDKQITEQGDPAQDLRAFRRCLGQFSTGVTVITGNGVGGPVGVTANSFSSLSMDPPLILWSISRSSRSFDAFVSATAFTVHILASDQIDLSQRFASKMEDKFAGIDWRPGLLGAPLIPGAAAILQCTTEAFHDAGDHVLLIGRVVHFARAAASALVFAQGRYAIAEDHPGTLQHEESRERTGTAFVGKYKSPDDLRFTRLVASLGVGFAALFEQFRQSRGVDLPQGFTLFALRDGRTRSFDEIVESSSLPPPSARDALASLEKRGCIACQSEVYALTSKGDALLASLMSDFSNFERQQMAGLSEQSVAVAREVLQELHDRLSA
ncbi:FMN reductase (NADH) NtaB [Variovorax sp. PBS-H4]|uniref:flavin reductase n=1 Tax=Variovorax sp. PBS-H4 TaxID=434008 RepID=UPI001318966E|nr:flavin reductase [Variovorax sp. PBS-H4]VTU40265.1 FMN reductase (NADH) NtaB [Variovorax sp. PBS-H4]